VRDEFQTHPSSVSSGFKTITEGGTYILFIIFDLQIRIKNEWLYRLIAKKNSECKIYSLISSDNLHVILLCRIFNHTIISCSKKMFSFIL
jgi:hypothetical protein